MHSATRAVITGIGIVSPAGTGAASHLEGLLAMRNPTRRLTLFDTAHTKAKHAAWIQDWDPSPWMKPHRLKRMERSSQFAVAAAALAIEDAGLRINGINPRAGVSVGTALGGFSQGEAQHLQFVRNGPDSVPPALGVQVFPATAQGNISMEFGLGGPCITNTNSCAAGNSALGNALRIIQRGEADIMIAGAAEAPISPLIFKAFDNLGAMSDHDGADPSQAYRPLQSDRCGFVMGEGAAMFVVESLSHALHRGAEPLAELTGYSITNEAFHMTSPHPDGAALQRCIRLAMAEAKIETAQLSYISPHASGTPANDVNELTQIMAALGEPALRIPISATKPFTGHTLGAAAAMEAATCLLAMKHGFIPPTLNLTQTNVDEQIRGCQLVHSAVKHGPVAHVLSIGLGFGGIDTALIFSPLS